MRAQGFAEENNPRTKIAEYERTMEFVANLGSKARDDYEHLMSMLDLAINDPNLTILEYVSY